MKERLEGSTRVIHNWQPSVFEIDIIARQFQSLLESLFEDPTELRHVNIGDVRCPHRITSTQIVLESGGKYRKSNGNKVGDTAGWMPSYLAEPTDALLLEIRKEFLCDNLRKIVWEKINVDVLADIYDKAKNGQHLKE